MSPRPLTRLPALALASLVALFLAAPAPAGVDDGDRALKTPLHVQPDPATRGERAAQIAVTAVGVAYRFGGESPVSGFDCSGLVRWAYGRVGVDLPHSSYALYGEGWRVSESGLRPGDILFFEGLGHVGLYLGRGRMVHAPQTGRDVEIVRLEGSSYGARLIGARRVTAP